MLRIKNGRRLLNKMIEEYLKKVYEYNSKLPKGVTLKPFHYVRSKGKTYVYIGKYFYKYERVNGKLKWKYVGKEPPKGCPPPPFFPLDGFSARVEGEDLLVSEEVYRKYLKDVLQRETVA